MQPVDWGGGIMKDVTLLQLSTEEGVTGLGSAYTHARNVEEAWRLFQATSDTTTETIPVSLA